MRRRRCPDWSAVPGSYDADVVRRLLGLLRLLHACPSAGDDPVHRDDQLLERLRTDPFAAVPQNWILPSEP